eukprot:11833085-Alexandrium_andersonii.AAC.1
MAQALATCRPTRSGATCATASPRGASSARLPTAPARSSPASRPGPSVGPTPRATPRRARA